MKIGEGRALYAKYCALCHGKDGKGYAADNAPSLVSHSLLAGGTDAYLRDSIARGRPGTAMGGYAKQVGGPLTEAEIAALVAMLRSGGPRAPVEPPDPPVPVGDPNRGVTVYAAECQRCHGDRTTRGTAPYIANREFQAAASDAFIKYAVVHGRDGTQMPAFEGKLSPAEIDDVVAYVRKFAPPKLTPPPRSAMPPGYVPPIRPVVQNPDGATPKFTLREGRYVPAEQVKNALERKERMVIVDARPTSDWFGAHLPGALTVPYYEMKTLDRIPKDGTWVLTYCACPHHASGEVLDELRRRGYPNTAVIDEGIGYWRVKNWPIETENGGTAPMVPTPMPAPALALPAPSSSAR